MCCAIYGLAAVSVRALRCGVRNDARGHGFRLPILWQDLSIPAVEIAVSLSSSSPGDAGLSPRSDNAWLLTLPAFPRHLRNRLTVVHCGARHVGNVLPGNWKTRSRRRLQPGVRIGSDHPLGGHRRFFAAPASSTVRQSSCPSSGRPAHQSSRGFRPQNSSYASSEYRPQGIRP